MQRFTRALVLVTGLLIAASAFAMPVGKYTSGGWGDPAQDGHGYSIEVMNDDLAIIFWYVYNPDGTSTFLLTVGHIDGNKISGDTSYYSGMKFGEFNPATLNEQFWGTVTVTFHDCNNATLNYNSTMQHKGVPFGAGAVQLKKLIEMQGMKCADNPHAGLYQGNFYPELFGGATPGLALLAPNGDFVSYSVGGIASFGTYQVNGQAITGQGTAISMNPDSYFKAALSFAGAIEADHRLVSAYTINGVEDGATDLFVTPALYQRGTSLGAIAGHYTGSNLITGWGGMATIAANGQVTGSDDSGCAYTGQVQVPDPRFNLLKVTFTVSQCAEANGNYSGYGMVDDYSALGDRKRVLLLASNGTYAALIELGR